MAWSVTRMAAVARKPVPQRLFLLRLVPQRPFLPRLCAPAHRKVPWRPSRSVPSRPRAAARAPQSSRRLLSPRRREIYLWFGTVVPRLVTSEKRSPLCVLAIFGTNVHYRRESPFRTLNVDSFAFATEKVVMPYEEGRADYPGIRAHVCLCPDRGARARGTDAGHRVGDLRAGARRDHDGRPRYARPLETLGSGRRRRVTALDPERRADLDRQDR